MREHGADTTPSTPSTNQSAAAAGGDGNGDGTTPASQGGDRTGPPPTAANTIPFLPSAWQEIAQAAWSAVKVLAAAAGSDVALAVGAAIAMTKDSSDASRQQMFYHYTDYPISAFSGGLIGQAWVTDVGTYSSQEASEQLGIRPPSTVIPILAYPGDFLPGNPFIVPDGKYGPGGGRQYYNPATIPPSQLLPPMPVR